MKEADRRQILLGTGAIGAASLAGPAKAQDPNPSDTGPRINAEGWDANSPPELAFLFEARVKLHLPATTLGRTPSGDRAIFFVKEGMFEGPQLRGRVMPNSGADWITIRPDGSGVLDVRFCLETDDNALLYLHWHGRYWAPPEHAAYALDVEKPDDPDGAWRYYFRTSPQFETSDPRYAWLNNTVAISKSRTGDGGPIHRVFAVL
ncbi:MAG: DUF3237 domain-containing protein [Pseudomonadota bacterium]